MKIGGHRGSQSAAPSSTSNAPSSGRYQAAARENIQKSDFKHGPNKDKHQSERKKFFRLPTLLSGFSKQQNLHASSSLITCESVESVDVEYPSKILDGPRREMSDGFIPAYEDNDLLAPPERITDGNSDPVFSVKLNESKNGWSEAIFKPMLGVDRSSTAAAAGIDAENPNTASRSLSTLALAKFLDFDVIVDTTFAAFTVPQTSGDNKMQSGLLMQKAPGNSGDETSIEVLKRPDTIKELIKLQLLDHLTAEVDRHGGNYFVHIDEADKVKVSGIDNELCFSHEIKSPNSIRPMKADERRHKSFLNTRSFYTLNLPPIVDSDSYERIKSLSGNSLKEFFSDPTKLLGRQERKALCSRLEILRNHVVKLNRNGLVVGSEDWENIPFDKYLDKYNNYSSREIHQRNAQQSST